MVRVQGSGGGPAAVHTTRLAHTLRLLGPLFVLMVIARSWSLPGPLKLTRPLAAAPKKRRRPLQPLLFLYTRWAMRREIDRVQRSDSMRVGEERLPIWARQAAAASAPRPLRHANESVGDGPVSRVAGNAAADNIHGKVSCVILHSSSAARLFQSSLPRCTIRALASRDLLPRHQWSLSKLILQKLAILDYTNWY